MQLPFKPTHLSLGCGPAGERVDWFLKEGHRNCLGVDLDTSRNNGYTRGLKRSYRRILNGDTEEDARITTELLRKEAKKHLEDGIIDVHKPEGLTDQQRELFRSKLESCSLQEGIIDTPPNQEVTKRLIQGDAYDLLAQLSPQSVEAIYADYLLDGMDQAERCEFFRLVCPVLKEWGVLYVATDAENENKYGLDAMECTDDKLRVQQSLIPNDDPALLVTSDLRMKVATCGILNGPQVQMVIPRGSKQ